MKTIQDIISEGISNKLWDKIDEMKEVMGADKLLEELCRCLSDDELEKQLKYICKAYEIKF